MFQRYEFNLTYLIALCAFDILLTFPREVKCIWQRPFSAISVIYPIIRYCPLGSAILRSIPIMWRSMDLVVSTFAISRSAIWTVDYNVSYRGDYLLLIIFGCPVLNIVFQLRNIEDHWRYLRCHYVPWNDRYAQ